MRDRFSVRVSRSSYLGHGKSRGAHVCIVVMDHGWHERVAEWVAPVSRSEARIAGALVVMFAVFNVLSNRGVR